MYQHQMEWTRRACSCNKWRDYLNCKDLFIHESSSSPEGNILHGIMSRLLHAVVVEQQLLIPTEIQGHLLAGLGHVPRVQLVQRNSRSEVGIVLHLLQDKRILQILMQDDAGNAAPVEL